MSEKIALVTGANKGIGREIVRQLAASGTQVWLGSRNLARGETAAAELRAEGLNVQALQLDMNDPATFIAAHDALLQKFGRLDILVNNAGINLQSFGAVTTAMTDAVLRETFEVNFFRLIELTHCLLPLIRQSPAGRIVNLSSVLASQTLQADPNNSMRDFRTPAYDMSKTALNSYTIHLAAELRDTTIRVNAAHPGWVKTELGGEEAPLDVTEGAKTAVALAGDDVPNGAYIHLGKPLPW